MPPPTWTPGEVLTSSDVNAWFVPLFAYKPSNTARTSNATPSADPHLTVAVAANAVYRLSAMIIYSADAASDIIVQWASPSGTAGTWSGFGPGTTVITCVSGTAVTSDTASSHGYMIRTEGTDLAASRTYGGITSSDIESVHIRGTVRVSSTSGNFALSWAQGVSGATATTVYADSHLELQRVG